MSSTVPSVAPLRVLSRRQYTLRDLYWDCGRKRKALRRLGLSWGGEVTARRLVDRRLRHAAAGQGRTAQEEDKAVTCSEAVENGGGSSNGAAWSSQQLKSFIAERGLAASLVQSEEREGEEVVKALVFEAGGEPVLVLVSGCHRVDERKLARVLSLSRRRVRLVKSESLVDICGFPMGSVPPFGHRRTLRTLVDKRLLERNEVFCGGGDPSTELRVSVPEMLQATAGELADVAEKGARLRAAVAAAGAAPRPWEEGEEAVELQGVVANRRRIARRLVFVTLVPFQRLVRTDQAAYIRKAWSHPATCKPAEVQLILGKTIERLLKEKGEDPDSLFRSIKIGTVIRVQGRPQPHISASAHSVGGGDILDVVVHSAEVLYRSREQALRAWMRQEREDQETRTSALRSCEDGRAPPNADARAGGGHGSDSAGGRLRPKLAERPLPGPRGFTQEAELYSPWYTLPLPQERVVMVESMAGVQAMKQEVMAAAEAAGGDEQGADLSKMQVLGIDAEWKPYSKGCRPSPVSVLQLATRDTAYLLDMQLLCRSIRGRGGGGRDQLQAAAFAAPPRQRRTAAQGASVLARELHSSAAGQAQSRALAVQELRAELAQLLRLTPEEAAVNEALEAFFSSAHVVKLGFQLHNDLHNLVASFPHLPVFHAAAVATGIWPEGAERNAAAAEHAGGAGAEAEDALQRLGLPMRSLVDLQTMLWAVHPWTLAGSARRIGLSRLCQLLLKKPLNKEQQVSDWGARPLSPEQLAYAANDAHVLVCMFDTLLASAPPAKWRGEGERGRQAVEASLRQWSSRDLLGNSLSKEGSSSREWEFLLQDHASGAQHLGAPAPAEQSAAASLEAASPVPTRSCSGRGASTSDTAGIQSGGSGGAKRGTATEGLVARVDELLASFLGRSMPAAGKEVVLRAAAGKDCNPDFARHGEKSGVLLWKNAVMLFINYSSGARGRRQSSRYSNPCLPLEGGGLGVVWATSSQHTPRHPAVLMLMAARQCCQPPLPAEPPAGAPAVLLFCRIGRRPYVFCGRLAVAAVEWTAGRGQFLLQLLDHEALSGSREFAQILERAAAAAEEAQGKASTPE